MSGGLSESGTASGQGEGRQVTVASLGRMHQQELETTVRVYKVTLYIQV